jgi:hypothetical protein
VRSQTFCSGAYVHERATRAIERKDFPAVIPPARAPKEERQPEITDRSSGQVCGPASGSFRGDDRGGESYDLCQGVGPVVPGGKRRPGGSVRADDLVCVVTDPGDERNEPIGETASKWGEAVVDPWRDRRLRLPQDEAVGLERAQGLREHLLADPFDAASESAPAHR